MNKEQEKKAVHAMLDKSEVLSLAEFKRQGKIGGDTFWSAKTPEERKKIMKKRLQAYWNRNK